MLSLANIKPKVNVASIGNMMGDSMPLDYVTEIEEQLHETIEALEKKILALKKLHTYQSISKVDTVMLKTVFPDRVTFIDSIPVTETPSRTGFTVIMTELYDGIMLEIVNLISWIRQRYISVIPVITDQREDGSLMTETLSRFKNCLAAAHVRSGYIADHIDNEYLINIASALIQAGINSPTGKSDMLKELTAQLTSGQVTKVTLTLSSPDIVTELVHQLETIRTLLNMAQTKEFSTLSGLTERLVTVSTASRMLRAVKIIPLWKKALVTCI